MDRKILRIWEWPILIGIHKNKMIMDVRWHHNEPPRSPVNIETNTEPKFWETYGTLHFVSLEMLQCQEKVGFFLHHQKWACSSLIRAWTLIWLRSKPFPSNDFPKFQNMWTYNSYNFFNDNIWLTAFELSSRRTHCIFPLCRGCHHYLHHFHWT